LENAWSPHGDIPLTERVRTRLRGLGSYA
jgi:hypothetical protein